MKKEYPVLIAIFLISFLVKFLFLQQFPHIPGVDSGYYVWHVDETLEGDIFLDDPPFVFFLSALFSFLFNDTIISVKIVIVLLSSLYVLPFYLIVKEITNNEKLGVFAALIGTFSGANWWVALGHVKNIAGLLFGLFVIYYFILCMKNFSRKNAVLLALSFLFMVGSHFSSSAYMVAPLMAAAFLILSFVLYTKSNENARNVCIALILFSFLVATSIIVLKPSLIGDSTIGTIGLQEESNTKFSPIKQGELFRISILEHYSIFSILALLGLYVLWRQNKELFILFSIWIFTSLLFTQPAFVDARWVLRFEMMSFLPFTILCITGLNFFESKPLLYSIMFLLFIFTTFDFLNTLNDPKMVISNNTYFQLVAFHGSNPDITVYCTMMPECYWFHAIGFEVIDGQPEPPFEDGDFLAIKNKQPGIRVGDYTFVPLDKKPLRPMP
ncbi:glycosyltransferase family 39 protein [Candidatus Micrarchaeota archaeon]|nr:glycosyltransferase family 39 protein [Candidatus Micrarchaeota archaeon]